jgi:ABC-type lipoprotein export system ATPase subunit
MPSVKLQVAVYEENLKWGKNQKKAHYCPWSRMSKPVLLIIAGCNGSGKSTFLNH